MYPDEIINKTIEFLIQYCYLDDEMYVRMYVDTYQNRKSKRQIIYDLFRKGISKDLVITYLETRDYSEEICFASLFNKYVSNKDLNDFKE